MARVHFIANGVFSTRIAGGDIHFLKLAEAAVQAGYELNFFGGRALWEVLQAHQLKAHITFTDTAKLGRADLNRLSGQFALFCDFLGRYRQSLLRLRLIQPDDYVYAVSDYWFDVLPAVRSRARRKLMVLHMEAPTLGQILRRSRPDVEASRLASVHYWASQNWSLRQFCRRPVKHLLYLHPLMRPRLERLGLRPEEMTLVSYGLDVAAAEAVPEQARVYDVVWIGRVHRQKGIEDLLETLRFLAQRIDGFRAVCIGNVREALGPEIQRRGLTRHVELPGFVSEVEKLRLFKASRLFLMPSRHEGSPRVIGESILCRTPVLAYELPNYRPLFGNLVRYVPAFDLAAFQAAAEQMIQQMRRGQNELQQADLTSFKRENDWATTQAKFLQALGRLRAA
jgi:glycosyltransferase involved in cell wall biosynthesis